MIKCISCNKTIPNTEKYSRFYCPNCGKIEIIRCFACKAKNIPYKCPSCNFEGP